MPARPALDLFEVTLESLDGSFEAKALCWECFAASTFVQWLLSVGSRLPTSLVFVVGRRFHSLDFSYDFMAVFAAAIDSHL